MKRKSWRRNRKSGSPRRGGLFSWVDETEGSRIPDSIRKQIVQEVESILREKFKGTVAT
ncbi:MAG: hypothetical protein QXS14_01755 [Desulfurococcaceae archaeon]